MRKKTAPNDNLRDRLSHSREITLVVTGRKSGRSIHLPVWFVTDDKNLSLLPVNGSDTQWYKNVLQNPSIRVEAGRAKAVLKAAPLHDPQRVSALVERFRQKYGENGIKLYSKLNVAVIVPLP
jgi:deazaflavin-dependent oxidoreductase (nitroreductase family)